jgi:uncharacterized protein (TIGR02145 family)
MKRTIGILSYPIVVSGIFILVITNNCRKDYGSVEDIDGNVYKTIVIGTQTWMCENLKTTRYQNGDPIQNVRDRLIWRDLVTGAFCDYNFSDILAATYGHLYNWYAIDDPRNIAPLGWHVASMNEWETLLEYVFETGYGDGYFLKESGTSHWASPNSASNSSGFTALPGGVLYDNFGSLTELAFFWTSTDSSPGYAWMYYIVHDEGAFRVQTSNYNTGASVRCIKD